MKSEREIRKEILDRIKKFHKLRKSEEKFIAGKSKIPYAGRVYDAEEISSLVNSALDFWLTAGKYAQEFEKRLAEFLKVKYCLLVNSGSSANLLAISALTSPELGTKRLQPGDEIITTACGFPTTLNPILQNNLIPVFVDIELETYNIDAGKIEEAISKKTRAIFIAHTLGNPANLDKIMKVIKKHKLWFIEDNCDSLGSKYKAKYTGSFGHVSSCSFYPPHHITMGEGGAVLTNDLSLQRLILSFRDWGRDCWCEPGQNNSCGRRFSQQHGKLPFGYDHKYVYSHIGYNLKVTDMQAAIGTAQLRKLNGFIAARKRNFNFLHRHLKKYEKYFILPQPTENSEPSWFGFPILIRRNAPFSRNEIVRYLEKNKISTRMLFGGNLTKQPAYKNIKCRISGKLNNTDFVMNNLFWIGVYPALTRPMLDFVVNCFQDFFEREIHP